ncbi:MAG: hypothetical protein QNK23_14645 [Crocinitomicaceae bacterium]|nr:hypothetical protein [Crocinitomicaceae bacterium]
MKKIILLIFPVFLAHSLYSQEEKHNAITLNWGMGNIMRQDLTVSPFIHQKWSPVKVGLNYTRTKKLDHLLNVEFGLYKPSVADPYLFNSLFEGELSSLAHNFMLINIDYALGKSVIENSKWDLIIGGKSRNYIYASDYNFGASGPSPMHISFGLDLWINVKYFLNEKHYFNANVSLPIFSYIYRAPYLAWNDEYFENISSHVGIKEFGSRIEDGQFQSWGTSQRVDFDINYGYVLNARWDIGMSYHLSTIFNQTPTSFTQIENVIYLSGKIKF